MWEGLYMALEHITAEQIAQKGVVAAPDRLTGKAEQNKMVFDRLVRELVAVAVNRVIDTANALEAAEPPRAQAEAARAAEEALRVLAESGRVSEEGLRVLAETGRVDAELARVAAEALRVSSTEGVVARAGTEADRAKAQADLAMEHVTAAGGEADRATGQANRATVEADRAKAEADRAQYIVGDNYPTRAEALGYVATGVEKHNTALGAHALEGWITHFDPVRVTVPLSGWTGAGPWTQTVAVAGVTAADSHLAVCPVDIPDAGARRLYEKAYGCLAAEAETVAGGVKLTCRAGKPEINFEISILGVR